VRFLGRRLYLAATVVLASALRSGLTDRRAQQLAEWLRVPRATIERWRAWWLQDFREELVLEDRPSAVHATDRRPAGQSPGTVQRP
jgi:hypothetical protein